jgi:hypothetical protein
MKEEGVEALLALWVLRLWWGVGEEKEFQKEGMCSSTVGMGDTGYGS